jgi:hypothetical protein
MPSMVLAGISTLVKTGPAGTRSALSTNTRCGPVRFHTATAALAPSRATLGSKLPGPETRTGGCQALPAGRSAARIAPVALLGQTATALPAGFMARRPPEAATFVATVRGPVQTPVVRDRPAPLRVVPFSQTTAAAPSALRPACTRLRPAPAVPRSTSGPQPPAGARKDAWTTFGPPGARRQDHATTAAPDGFSSTSMSVSALTPPNAGLTAESQTPVAAFPRARRTAPRRSRRRAPHRSGRRREPARPKRPR